jgi:hypothetical protein
MSNFRDRDTGEIKTRLQCAQQFNGALPRVWKAATFDALNVDPVLPVPKPQPSAPNKTVVDAGAEKNNLGQWVTKWEEVDRFQGQQDELEYISLQKDIFRSAIRSLASEKRDGGIVFDGLEISTTASARSLLIGGRQNPKSTRKIVTKGGRMEISQAAFEAVNVAVSEYIQDVIDREYDLLEAVDALQDLEAVAAFDYLGGWPSRIINSQP